RRRSDRSRRQYRQRQGHVATPALRCVPERRTGCDQSGAVAGEDVAGAGQWRELNSFFAAGDGRGVRGDSRAVRARVGALREGLRPVGGGRRGGWRCVASGRYSSKLCVVCAGTSERAVASVAAARSIAYVRTGAERAAGGGRLVGWRCVASGRYSSKLCGFCGEPSERAVASLAADRSIVYVRTDAQRATGPAFLTASLTESSYFLKFSRNISASFAACAS